MRHHEAFRKLGYEPAFPYAWTAAKADGVCLTIWGEEISTVGDLRFIDTRNLPSAGTYEWKQGHRNRAVDLERALHEFGGYVDVVLLFGDPRKRPDGYELWNNRRDGGYWRVTDLYPDGNYRAEVTQGPPPNLHERGAA